MGNKRLVFDGDGGRMDVLRGAHIVCELDVCWRRDGE